MDWSEFIVNDINQLRIDTFGTTYSLDNDGLANLSGPIRDWNSGVSTLAWHYTGACDWKSTVRLYNPAGTFYYDIIRSSLAANETALLPLLVANPRTAAHSDTFVFADFAQTLTSKTAHLINDSSIATTKKLYFDGNGLGTVGNTYLVESAADIVDLYVGGVNYAKVDHNTTSFQVLNADLIVPATKKLLLDGSTSGNTYLTESSADIIDVYAGGTNYFKFSHTNTFVQLLNADYVIPSTKKLLFDGAYNGNTYATESSADVWDLYVGGVKTISSTTSSVTLAAPTFSDFTNCNHDHGDADDGGTLSWSTIFSVSGAGSHAHSSTTTGGTLTWSNALSVADAGTHAHSNNTTGGTLTWDNIFSANNAGNHDHSSITEGGLLPASSLPVHAHSASNDGGTLTWDNIFSVAGAGSHDHSSTTEGGTGAHALYVKNNGFISPHYTRDASGNTSFFVDHDSFDVPDGGAWVTVWELNVSSTYYYLVAQVDVLAVSSSSASDIWYCRTHNLAMQRGGTLDHMGEHDYVARNFSCQVIDDSGVIKVQVKNDTAGTAHANAHVRVTAYFY